jgi:hypothetical protein
MANAHIPVCARIRLKSNSLTRVREWVAHITQHKVEALQTLAAEGASIESVFLDSTKEGDFLLVYMRAVSHERAQQVAAASTAEIDRYHQAFKREAWAEVRSLELLLDLEQHGA